MASKSFVVPRKGTGLRRLDYSDHVATGATCRHFLTGWHLSSKVDFLVHPQTTSDDNPLRVKEILFVVAGIRRLAIALAN